MKARLSFLLLAGIVGGFELLTQVGLSLQLRQAPEAAMFARTWFWRSAWNPDVSEVPKAP
jgi:hypothetical protein